MARQKILFLDDEPEWSGVYLEDLNDVFEVVVFHQAGAALKYFDDFQDVEALVLDIMIPTPVGVSSVDTNLGLDTGIWFLERIRKYVTAHQCPVVFITNRGKENFSERLKNIGLPDTLCAVRLKSDTPSERLPIIVKQMMNSARR